MTFRSQNNKIEWEGVRFVQGVVQDHNSIFQHIARENDQGNDCYIEFVEAGLATNYGVFMQIKSGSSYRDGKGYKIPSDKRHLEYWSNGLYLNIGVVYDPEARKAFWVDITAYLKERPELLTQKNHAIRVPPSREFSHDTFAAFISYCKSFRALFTSHDNFGQSLEKFADLEHPPTCYEGLKSLFSTHKDKPASWHYITASFSRIAQTGIKGTILGMLSNYADDEGDTFYTENTLPSPAVAAMVREAVGRNFKREEVEAAYPFLREGIIRGSFSYRSYKVLRMANNLSGILRQISFDPTTSHESRVFWFWLYLHTHKWVSAPDTLEAYSQFIQTYPEALEDEVIEGVAEAIKNGELWPMG